MTSPFPGTTCPPLGLLPKSYPNTSYVVTILFLLPAQKSKVSASRTLIPGLYVIHTDFPHAEDGEEPAMIQPEDAESRKEIQSDNSISATATVSSNLMTKASAASTSMPELSTASTWLLQSSTTFALEPDSSPISTFVQESSEASNSILQFSTISSFTLESFNPPNPASKSSLTTTQTSNPSISSQHSWGICHGDLSNAVIIVGLHTSFNNGIEVVLPITYSIAKKNCICLESQKAHQNQGFMLKSARSGNTGQIFVKLGGLVNGSQLALSLAFDVARAHCDTFIFVDVDVGEEFGVTTTVPATRSWTGLTTPPSFVLDTEGITGDSMTGEKDMMMTSGTESAVSVVTITMSTPLEPSSTSLLSGNTSTMASSRRRTLSTSPSTPPLSDITYTNARPSRSTSSNNSSKTLTLKHKTTTTSSSPPPSTPPSSDASPDPAILAPTPSITILATFSQRKHLSALHQTSLNSLEPVRSCLSRLGVDVECATIPDLQIRAVSTLIVKPEGGREKDKVARWSKGFREVGMVVSTKKGKEAAIARKEQERRDNPEVSLDLIDFTMESTESPIDSATIVTSVRVQRPISTPTHLIQTALGPTSHLFTLIPPTPNLNSILLNPSFTLSSALPLATYASLPKLTDLDHPPPPPTNILTATRYTTSLRIWDPHCTPKLYPLQRTLDHDTWPGLLANCNSHRYRRGGYWREHEWLGACGADGGGWDVGVLEDGEGALGVVGREIEAKGQREDEDGIFLGLIFEKGEEGREWWLLGWLCIDVLGFLERWMRDDVLHLPTSCRP
ncbi:uncharacterized protein BDR25DRAFT_349817 [Lindgomyces ingoldianus]|uniref:Uncharacterized protein n=1 Tax=Lindgomyces ingoldianus TaxID=673940 RepID=A0ACB6RC77_9PLEO|nr:uncharacterized protein BDR25DRAFT_349817 [Lindgomyces ingoldianus]KAF2476756.1 hypothetical protein BDR25DRAFT_349817 [Lindgomyces ingoldianus]